MNSRPRAYESPALPLSYPGTYNVRPSFPTNLGTHERRKIIEALRNINGFVYVRLYKAPCESGRDFALEVSREQSYGIFQEALVNYGRWVNQAHGIEIWLPATLPECALGIPY